MSRSRNTWLINYLMNWKKWSYYIEILVKGRCTIVETLNVIGWLIHSLKIVNWSCFSSDSRMWSLAFRITEQFLLTYYCAFVIEVTEGLLDSRCELSDPRSLSGKVLLLNTSSLRCKMLIKEKNFIKKIEKSEVSALVIMDDTPRYFEFVNFQ